MSMGKLMYRWGLVGLTFLVAACGGASGEDGDPDSVAELDVAQSEIKNGQAATNSNLTVVQLTSELDGNDGVIDGSFTATCSGMIIAQDTIVTAAHCFRVNVPTAASRWWTKNVKVRVGAQAATGSAMTPLTLDSSGNWAFKTAAIRIHSNYNGFRPNGGSWTSHSVPNDIAVIRFPSPSTKPDPPPFRFPGITSVSQLPWLDSTGTTRNGWLFGYGTDGSTNDFRAGFFSCSKSGGILTCNDGSTSSPQGCPGDSGGPQIAGASLGVPTHQFGVHSTGNCSSSTQNAPISGNLSFVIASLSGRCTTQTFTSQTPPPQSMTTLTRCF
jgi:hypothetical protein